MVGWNGTQLALGRQTLVVAVFVTALLTGCGAGSALTTATPIPAGLAPATTGTSPAATTAPTETSSAATAPSPLAVATLTSTSPTSPLPRGTGTPPSPTARLHSPTLASAPAQAPTAATTSDLDWPTYHRDNARTGVNPATVGFTALSEVWRSSTLDGDVYAEPLVVGGRVLIATENNTLYSFDLASGRQIWRTHLGEPMSGASLPCGNISTSGITGTPVVDPTRGLLDVVEFVQPGRHLLAALDLTTGTVRYQTSIDPPGSDPLAQQERSALSLANNLVYVPFGGLFGDCGAYHGWMVAADPATGAVRASYQVPTDREGAIWAPPGATIDATGSLYVATGNGSSTSESHFDYGDAVLRLSPDLRLLDWFAPTNWAALNRADADVGSMSPSLLDGGTLFQIGKAGVGYLLRASQLGHVGGQVYQAPVCRAAFGGTAYQSPVLYVPCTDGLVALRVTTGDFATAWTFSSDFAGPPIVAGGIVWTITRDGSLVGLDPLSGQVRARQSLGAVNHFVTPAASGPYLISGVAKGVVVWRLR